MNNILCLIISLWIIFAIAAQAFIFYFVTLPRLESDQNDSTTRVWTYEDIERSNYI